MERRSTEPMSAALPPSPPRPEGHRLAWLGGAAALGVLLGLATISSSATGRRAVSARELRLYGEPLPSDGDIAEVALAAVQSRLRGWFNLELPDGELRRVSAAELGVEVDAGRLRQVIRNARTGTYDGAIDPAMAPGVDVLVPVQLNRARALSTLLLLKDELDRAAFDARLDLDLEAVVPERAGRWLDVDRSLLSIERAIERGASSAPLGFEARLPRRAASQLADVRYDALLGFFETPYDVAPRAVDHAHNLELAASKLDGYVLMPGGELDFNAVVGPRDEANGYRVAQVIAAGELVDGIGGDICRISGTLHAAALFAGLEIIERHPDTRPSSRIALGFDAAVAYPVINLRLMNPHDFPVVLHETVARGRVRAEVRGAHRPQTITVVRKIDSATPFEQLEQPDDALARGVRVLAQRGVPGMVLHRYRIRRVGAHAVRQVVTDRYPPTPQLILVGTGTSTSTSRTGRPPHDASPEYLADELIVMTQTANLDGPLVEQRVAGRFGLPGWTKNFGTPARPAAPRVP
jgi:vancomycin resistance protein YoaR